MVPSLSGEGTTRFLSNAFGSLMSLVAPLPLMMLPE